MEHPLTWKDLHAEIFTVYDKKGYRADERDSP
jgi:hypothetical protein